MSEQRYEYKIEHAGGKRRKVEALIHQYASEGYRLAHTFGYEGSCTYLVFERPSDGEGLV